MVSIAFVIFVYTAHVRNRAVFSLLKTYRKFYIQFSQLINSFEIELILFDFQQFLDEKTNSGYTVSIFIINFEQKRKKKTFYRRQLQHLDEETSATFR